LGTSDHPDVFTCAISVVIPVFNGALYIAEALASIAGQSVSASEIIVIDDGSTDGTAGAVRAASDGRVHYVRQDRAGAAAARNRGAALASGTLLAFLDADDLWLEDKLRRQLACLARDDVEMAFCLIDEFISPDLDADAAARLRPRAGLLQGVAASTLLIARRDFERVGGFDPQLGVGEFVDWYDRACALGLRSLVAPELLCRRRLHLTNQGRSNHAQRGQYAEVAKRLLDRRRAAGSAL
jgi:glycosyltransferase involved in cell wall biosynthesis